MSKNIVDELREKYHLVNDMFGIYMNWLIDHNIDTRPENCNPNGIAGFQGFLDCCRWQLVKVVVGDQEMLAVDIDLKYFSICQMIGLQKTVLEENLSGREIFEHSKAYHLQSGLNGLDQLQFYLQQVYSQPANDGIEIGIIGGPNITISKNRH